MVPLVRAASDPRYQRVIGIFASQSGKTDSLLNIAGHRIDDDPAPVLFVGPTRSNVEKVIEPRVVKMISSAKSLSSKFIPGKKNSKTQKIIAGVKFRMAWAGSATELASDPAALAFVDERDRMDDDIEGEGDPVEIIEARTATYPDGTVVVTSSPTTGTVRTYVHPDSQLEHWELADSEDISSPIWKLWQEGTRHEWAVPCPDCEEYFIPRFKLLTWPEGSTPEEAYRDARLACPGCGSLIEDSHRLAMNARGVAVAPGQSVTPEGEVTGPEPSSDTFSIWCSGLMSPFRSFGSRARQFLRAVRSGEPGRIQAAINTGLGELYTVTGDAPEWEQVASLREDYRAGECPKGVMYVTLYVDVQKDRLIYGFRGWGAKLESWGLGHGEIMGDTALDQVWIDLAKLGTREFGGLPVHICGIDSGYRPGDKFKRPTNQIYAFCRRFKGWARPTKGHDKQDKPIRPSKIDVTIDGRTYKKGLVLHHLDSDYFKSWVHQRLEWPAGHPGGWHLSADYDDDYCKQLVAETRAQKPSGHVVWVRTARDNHYLDVEAGNVACAHMLNLHVTLAETFEPEDGPAEPAKIQRRRGRTVRSRGLH